MQANTSKDAARLARVFLTSLVFVVVPSLGAAHSPHDEVRDLALSTTFGQDGVAFAVARQPPRALASLLRTTNGGDSWARMWNGLNVRGEVTSVCVSPNFHVDGTVFLTTASDGSYVSQDQGLSWTQIGNVWPFQRVATGACALDASEKPVFIIAGVDGGAARTDDLGASWSVLVGGQVTITAFAVSPTVASDGLIIAGTSQGAIVFSTDHGSSWSLASALAGAGIIHDIASTSNGAATYVATDAIGLQRTTDGGKTFTPVNNNLPSEPIRTVALSPNFDQDQTVFAASAYSGVFKSTDAGANWIQYTSGLVFDDDVFVQTDYRHHAVAVSNDYANDNTVLAGTFEGSFRSVDGGMSWFQLETAPLRTIRGVALSPEFATDATLAVVRYGGGAGLSVDGGTTWVPANLGIESPFLYDVAFSPDYLLDTTLFAAAPRYASVKSSDAGQRWVLGALLGNLQGNKVTISPTYDVDQTVFLGSRHDGIFRTVDGGASWTRVYVANTRIDSLAISPTFAADGTVFAGQTVFGVVRTTDGGLTWQAVNSGLPIDNSRGTIVALSPDFSSDRRVLAATLHGLYESTSAGDTWSAVTIVSGAADAPVEDVAMSPAFATDRTVVASVRGRGLFESTDAGASWSELAPELIANNLQLQKILFSPAFETDQTIFGYSDDHLLRSADGGGNWVEIEHGPVRHESNNPQHQWFAFEGTGQGVAWTEASAGGLTWLRSPGSRARFFFNGRGATWIGARAPFLGIADVYVDGVLQTTVDQYGSTIEPRAALLTISGLTPGLHELQIVVTGNSNPQASDFGAAVDAIDVTR